MRGNFATGVVERFGKINHGKGVKVDLADDRIPSTSIRSNSGSRSRKWRQAFRRYPPNRNMTSLTINEINIHIVGIQFDTKAQEVEIDEEM